MTTQRTGLEQQIQDRREADWEDISALEVIFPGCKIDKWGTRRRYVISKATMGVPLSGLESGNLRKAGFIIVGMTVVGGVWQITVAVPILGEEEEEHY